MTTLLPPHTNHLSPEDLRSSFANVSAEVMDEINQHVSSYQRYRKFHWDAQLIQDLQNFSTRGKLLRGVGFILLAESFLLTANVGSNKNISTSKFERPNLLKIAAALELFQSALLIHDDIMDNDERRRGAASIFKLYQTKSEELNLKQPRQLGISVAICMADIAFFMAQDALLLSSVPAELRLELISICNQELIQLGLSQLEDSYLAATPEVVVEEDILRMYVGKTARYTWRWPLLMAAAVGAQSPEVRIKLEELAEVAGLVFQLKDDELGLFGDEEKIGKPVISDVREGKKTLYWFGLQKHKDEARVQAVLPYFGNSAVTEEDVAVIRSLVVTVGIRQEVDEKMQHLYNQAQTLIAHLPVPEQTQLVLQFLLDASYHRSK